MQITVQLVCFVAVCCGMLHQEHVLVAGPCGVVGISYGKHVGGHVPLSRMNECRTVAPQ